MAKPKSLPYEAPTDAAPYSVALHSQAGGSDKVYQLSIESHLGGSGWNVHFANGRRGGTLATGLKTKNPVDYPTARKICNDVLFDKVGGGYVPTGGSHFGDGMQAEAIAAIAREASGVIPQLLNPIDVDDLDRFIEDDLYVAQRKHDGERRTVIVVEGVAKGSNRKGQTVALPRSVTASALWAKRDVTIDGEQIGDTLHVFDLLSLDGRDTTAIPLEQRLALLDDLSFGGAIRISETATNADDKRALLDKVRSEGGEGVVFKRFDSEYRAGRPASGGDWRKFKLWQSLSAIVTAQNAQRSVAIGLINDAGQPVAVGNVTIPANAETPDIGAVIEVGYLYAYEAGSLFQPTYKGVRADLSPADCLASQRVFKAQTLEDEPAPAFGM